MLSKPKATLAIGALVALSAAHAAPRSPAEARDFYARYGVSRESWHVQRTPHGTWIIGVTQLGDMPVDVAARQFGESERPFDRWFKDQILRLSGVNVDEQPLGPPTECIFDTAGVSGPAPADG